METYLFKFSGCLLVFWLVYVLFLERQTMHRFKRFYLLGAVVLALIIPVLTITHYIEPIVTDFEVAPLFIPIEPVFTEIPLEQAPFWNLENILWILYGLGFLLFSIRFTVNLFKMYKRISNNETIIKRSFVYVLLEEYRIPHSFFKYIFFNKLKYKEHNIPKEVMLHEETHAKQLHSLDVLVIELLQIIFWFNPLIYILKYHIKLNHEFLADQAVLNQGSDAKTYQNILLQFSSPDSYRDTDEYQLSSAINYSSIKKRFTVMKTQTSKTRIWVSGLLLLPIIAILFYSFAEKEYVEKETVDISQLQITSTNEGATEAMMTEYNDWMKKLNTNSSNLFIAVGKIERIVAIYDLMSEEQRNSVDKHPFLQEITPDLYHVKPSIPSTAQFESWKNEKEFAIWLDGKHISNTELNNFKANDIAHYIGSSVHSNAKSKKFPQPFQFSLYTKDGFNKFYKEAYVNDYRALTKTYSNEIDTYLNGPQTDNSELRILKAQADKLYNQFTKEELEKHNILPAPPVPSKKEPSYSKSKGGPNFEDTKDIYNSARSIELKILNNNSYLIDGIKATKNTFVNVFNQLHQDITTEVRNNIMNIHVTSAKEISNKEVWFIYNSLQDYGFYRIVTPNQEINRAKGNTPFAIESSFLAQEKPIMLILINRHDELLVDDELGTLESIDKKLKKLAKAGKSGQIVSIRYDRETSKEMISNVEELVKVHKFKLVSFNISPIMSILINRKDQLLVDDELSTLKSMENKLKKLAKQGESGRQVIIKHDKETSKDMISKVEELVKANKFKVASFDMSKIPPPPPPTPSPKKTKGGPIEINGATYYFKQQNGKTTYYNQYGKEVDINKIPPPPPIPNDATPEQKAKMKKATDAYMKANSDKVGKAEGENGEVFDVIEIPEDLQGSININGETFYYTTSNGKTTYFNRYGKEVKMDNLPPPAPAPAPESTLDFVIRMAKGNAKFFNEGKLISSDEAIALLKKNPKLNINAKKTKTRQPLVYISKKPIVIEKN